MRLWLVEVACASRMRWLEPRLVATLFALVGFALALGGASAGEATRDANGRSPQDWLARMAQALSQLEYEGTLVYLHGHELSTLRIAHRIENGQPRESLLALSGPIRAVARSHQRVTCVLPDARAISVPRHPQQVATTLHPGSLDLERLQPHYLIHPLGRSRVAGRDTRVIGIIPKDDLRYGYRFFIDERTGLPLKTDLMNSAATPIEQVMFTEVDFLGPRNDEQGVPAMTATVGAETGIEPESPHESRATTADLTAAAVAEVAAEPSRAAPATSSPGAAPGPWTFAELPAGYRVDAADADGSNSERSRRWFMVSDGLSAISVYIEPDRGHGLDGVKRVGAVNAAGRSVNGHQITAVGEAPLQTVEAIADAVVINSDAEP